MYCLNIKTAKIVTHKPAFHVYYHAHPKHLLTEVRKRLITYHHEHASLV
jgi:hypothetical protein